MGEAKRRKQLDKGFGKLNRLIEFKHNHPEFGVEDLGERIDTAYWLVFGVRPINPWNDSDTLTRPGDIFKILKDLPNTNPISKHLLSHIVLAFEYCWLHNKDALANCYTFEKIIRLLES